jgi:tyrosyl-tRNA synthetase
MESISLSPDQSLELILDNLAEVIGRKELEEKVRSGVPLKVYWGTAPTGKPHLGYLIPMIKIAQLVKAGCELTIMFADLHAYLDAMKTSWELLEYRTKYYSELIVQILQRLQVDTTKIRFIKGSEYQLKPDYTIDVYKLASKLTIDSAKKAGAEVVKQSIDPALSGLIYPILQILDEVYLGTDAELGGVDQRKIFMASHDHIHKIGYKPNIHLMNRMIPSLNSQIKDNEDDELGEKMSSSDSNSKIELTSSSKVIRKKISKAYLEEGNIRSPVLEFVKHVIFPINKLLGSDEFVIQRDIKWGGPIEFKSFDQLTNAYGEKTLSPQDLKLGIADWVINFLEPIRDYFSTYKMQELESEAYPDV